MLKFGLVGKRGASFIPALQTIPTVEVAAFCDIDPVVLEQVTQRYGISQRYSNYEDMLGANLDAIVVATPMHLHVPQTIAALQAGMHVLCEVPAAVSLDECWQLVEQVEKSGRIYMMAENCCYMRDVVLVKELVQRGYFGELYFGQGEYIHELKELNEKTPWRRIWQTGRNGNTYPTHSVGPLLQWMDEQVASVCCLGSGHHYRDSEGKIFANEDTTMTLCKLQRGGMLELRLDMLSNRPHNMTYYTLQGTKGCYEAPRFPGEDPRIWLADFCSNMNEWKPLSAFTEHLPEKWRNPPPVALAAGHGGSDYWQMFDFIQAIETGEQPAINVRVAAHWTAVGLCTEMSIARGGDAVNVPTFA